MRTNARSRWILALAALPLLASAAVACGDGPEPQTPFATATSTSPTPKPNPYVLNYRPAEGATVPQKDTVSVDNQVDPVAGPCFEADYSQLTANLRSFRMYIDRTDRTLDFKWTLPQNPASDKKPRACFVNKAGLAPGTHTVTIVIRQTENVSEAPLSQLQWTFQVR